MAALVRLTRDFDEAEDALQDAFTIAATRWPSEGIPKNPGGWIMTTAKRRSIDRLRRTKTGEAKLRLVSDSPETTPDDRLMLIFTCCHPALSLEARVALTLRTVCGLTTEEIAAAFVVSIETMAKRIVRAKRKVKLAQIAYEAPDPDDWEPRVASVLATIYLAFTKGYDLGPADRRGIEISEQAIELGELMSLLIPREPEIEGLVALMLFTHARRSARQDRAGNLVLLPDQDQALWDEELLERARKLISAAPRHGSVGQYWIQAAIASVHTAGGPMTRQQWRSVVALYDRLLDQTAGSPIVQLNRAVAVAEVSGPIVALELIAELDDELAGHAYLPAVRADLYRRSNQPERAAGEYQRAIDLTPPGPRRASLHRALSQVSSDC